MPETIKLIGSRKRKITENEHGENKIYLEVTELLLDY